MDLEAVNMQDFVEICTEYSLQVKLCSVIAMAFLKTSRRVGYPVSFFSWEATTIVALLSYFYRTSFVSMKILTIGFGVFVKSNKVTGDIFQQRSFWNKCCFFRCDILLTKDWYSGRKTGYLKVLLVIVVLTGWITLTAH